MIIIHLICTAALAEASSGIRSFSFSIGRKGMCSSNSTSMDYICRDIGIQQQRLEERVPVVPDCKPPPSLLSSLRPCLKLSLNTPPPSRPLQHRRMDRQRLQSHNYVCTSPLEYRGWRTAVKEISSTSCELMVQLSVTANLRQVWSRAWQAADLHFRVVYLVL